MLKHVVESKGKFPVSNSEVGTAVKLINKKKKFDNAEHYISEIIRVIKELRRNR